MEVMCRSSGKVRWFAPGTTACYALHAINRKLEPGAPPALHVEAVRDGKEPISFSPSAAHTDYGHGWRLQTVTVPFPENRVQTTRLKRFQIQASDKLRRQDDSRV